MTQINGYEVVGRMPIFTSENRVLVRCGAKTQTRRIVKNELRQYDESLQIIIDRFIAPVYSGIWQGYHDSTCCLTTKCPYGQVGDIRVMPEPLHRTVKPVAKYEDDTWVYVGGQPLEWKWKRDTLSSMFMPTWAGRTLVRYTQIWVDHLQNISWSDALAEGIFHYPAEQYGGFSRVDLFGLYPIDKLRLGFDTPGCCNSPVGSFHHLWDSINGKAHPWDSNPWVWCLEWELLQF